MKTRTRAAFAALAGVLLPAIAATAAEPSAFDAPEVAARFEFARIKSVIPIGDKIGYGATGLFCSDRHEVRANARIEPINNAEAATAFRAELAEQGLTPSSADVSAFDNGPSVATPDYRVGGVLQVLTIDECTHGTDHKGKVAVTVKWEVFAPKLQKVVFTKVTTGQVSTDSFEPTSGREFESGAYTVALRELMSDPAFKALRPVDGPAAASTVPPAAATTAADAATPVSLHLKSAPATTGGAQANAPALRDAVATVLHDNVTGSGFYIADDYLVTNRHVVGTTHYVKVKLANGRVLVGEVVREDARRDVALIKTEPAGVKPLRIDMAEQPVGEDVFAIGSPLGEDLAGTFTRGVLSGTRQVNGLEFLQSDAAVNPGNSGGPLLNAASTVIGMTVLKIEKAAGLSFFIPMRDVANALHLVFD